MDTWWKLQHCVLCTLQQSNKQSTLADYFMGTGVQIENVAKNLCVCVCVCVCMCVCASALVFMCGDHNMWWEGEWRASSRLRLWNRLLCLTAITELLKNGQSLSDWWICGTSLVSAMPIRPTTTNHHQYPRKWSDTITLSEDKCT